MKKLCLLLVLLLVLTGCAQEQPQTAQGSLVSFDVFAINDLHGRFADTKEQPGVDELSTYLSHYTGNRILLSTGDMWQGTYESNLTRGFIITEWMNEMGFDAMTLGGHEFDWGEDWLKENEKLARFPYLGINIFSRLTNERVDYCQSSITVEFDGAKIGIIGSIGDNYSSISPEYTKDIYFKVDDEMTQLVKDEAQKLRAEGADFIIYSVHEGYTKTTDHTEPMKVSDKAISDYYDAVLSEGYVDLVFEADSHYWYLLQDDQGVYHLQGGGNNSGLSHARVMIDTAKGTSQILVAELIPNSEYEYLQSHPVVEELMEKYADQIAPGTRVLGYNSQYRNGNAICQLVAQLYCEKGVEKWGGQYDIFLGGGYLKCRSPGQLEKGNVTYDQLLSILPFDNQITLCSIQGKDLISKFLETKNDAYHIQTTAYGQVNRNNIDPNGTYYVITDSYSAYYRYNNMTVIDTYDPDIFARDLLADYITAGGLT